MNLFWLVFHLALLIAALVWVGKKVWGKIQDKFTPGI